MNTFDLTLDLSKRGLIQTVTIRQGDQNGTTIAATITDHGVAASTSGLTARFQMRLPNGTEYYRKAATLSGSVATVTIDEAQAASAVGRTDVAYFQLLQGSTVVASTESFTVVVLPDALADATVPESYDSAIQDAIDALDDAVADLPATVEDVLADHPEWTTTVQDGSITEAKLATDLARDRERLLYRLDNLLTAQLPEGETATATDAAKTPMAWLALYGRSTQDGTPTPSAPVPIVSVGPNLVGDDFGTWVTGKYLSPDGTIVANSQYQYNEGYFPVKGGATYMLAAVKPATSGNTAHSIAFYDSEKSILSRPDAWGTGDAGEFFGTVTAPDNAVWGRVTVANGGSKVRVFEGSDFAPYVPHGCVGLFACGKNLFSRIMVGYSMNTSTGEWAASNANNFVSAPMNCTQSTLTLLVNSTGGYGGSFFFTCYAQDGTFLGVTNGVYFNSMTVPYRATINLKSGTVTARAYGYYVSGAAKLFDAELAIYDGTVSDAYEPYTETTIPIDLDGHELRSLPDGTRDELTVDQYGHAVLVQRVGELTPQGESSIWSARESDGRIVVRVPDIKPTTGNNEVSPSLSDRFVFKSLNAATSVGDAAVWPNESGDRARVTLNTGASGISSIPAAAAWLAANPVTLVYPLAIPQTIDLGTIDPVPLVGPDLTAQAVPTAPFALTYERDLNATLARLESAIANLV